MKTLALALMTLLLATPALAQDKPAAPDMSKMGPWAKTVTNEKQSQKDLDAWFKAWMAAEAKGDLDAMVGMLDFPVLMMTDSMAGEFRWTPIQKDAWTAMMKPFMDPGAQKDMKMSGHKKTCYVLSDDLASCEGQVTLAMGKQKMTLKNHWIMTRVGGQWKGKSMMEAGWGDTDPNEAAPPTK